MNNKAHLRPKDFDSNVDIIPMACKEEKGDLISREALKKALEEYKYCGFYDKLIEIIDNAPTVEDHSLEIAQKSIELGRRVGKTEGTIESQRPQDEWEDYSVDFYKCPECGYLLNKDCPYCQNKIILPKGGAE